MRDLHHNLNARTALAPAAISSDTTSAGEVIDRQGFESLEFLFVAGTLTDGVFTVALAESDTVDESGDLTGENAVASTDRLGDLPSLTNDGDAVDESGVTKTVGYIGNKRYVRLDVVSTDTDDGGEVGAIAVLGHPRNAPVE